MSDIPNPPAFPRTGEGLGNPSYDEVGMTLRDWFAGQALAGASLSSDPEYTKWVAGNAYRYADAMLRARQGEPA